MKHARVIHQSQSFDARAHEDGILLSNNELLPHGSSAYLALTWLPPLEPLAQRARTIFCLGLNYSDHAKELAFKPPEEPLAFLKGESSLIGHRSRTLRPADATHMHYECELAVVIARSAKNIRAADAYDFVQGYCVANDYAIRDYLENWYRPNLRVKGRPTCTPIGPWRVDAADVSDPMNLKLETRVEIRGNSIVTQRGNTRDMIFSIPTLIEYFSSLMTLQAGDIILTGTPDGVIDCPAGSRVECEIEGLGVLENLIVC